MLLSIIIVNYNMGALVKTCVESLLPQINLKETEIIVVDNNSQDESVALLRSDFPEIRVIDNQANVGLAAGVNRGIKEAKGRYYLILNPDIIALPGSVKALFDYMEKHPRVGAAGAQLLSPNGKVQYTCFRFYRPSTIIYRRTRWGKTAAGRRELARFLMKDFDRRILRPVEWLMGACLMIRGEAVKTVGGMDERFFLYFEDVDWCRRFWQASWQVMYVPLSQFSHFHQRSSEGGLMRLLSSPSARAHITSAIKYFLKYRGQPVPMVY